MTQPRTKPAACTGCKHSQTTPTGAPRCTHPRNPLGLPMVRSNPAPGQPTCLLPGGPCK